MLSKTILELFFLTLFFVQSWTQNVYHTFDQKVDHFDFTNTKTYKQRYFTFDTHFKGDGPIFIFLGGEAPLQFFDFQEVQEKVYAQQFSALYIGIEHRFYGKSMPCNDYSVGCLKYLSSKQALADAAYFIEQYSAQNNLTAAKNPWVVFGCSYSGALSAWFRSKYPSLVVGAVAPSGPVFATNNFTQYFSTFQRVAPPTCVNAVQGAVSQIETKFQTASGRSELSQTFNSCKPLTPSDQWYFFWQVTNAIGGSDQYENPPKWPLNATCDTITKSSNTLQNIASLMGGGQCTNFDEQSDFIQPMADTSNPSRSWYWQKCTEFGFFKPTSGSIFFPNTLDQQHELKWCAEIFGIPNMIADIQGTNDYYGGYNVAGSNIIFTNGVFDPWHHLSVNQDIDNGRVQAAVYDAGHCAPFIAATPEDPPSVVAARVKVGDSIKKWVA